LPLRGSLIECPDAPQAGHITGGKHHTNEYNNRNGDEGQFGARWRRFRLLRRAGLVSRRRTPVAFLNAGMTRRTPFFRGGLELRFSHADWLAEMVHAFLLVLLLLDAAIHIDGCFLA